MSPRRWPRHYPMFGTERWSRIASAVYWRWVLHEDMAVRTVMSFRDGEPRYR